MFPLWEVEEAAASVQLWRLPWCEIGIHPGVNTTGWLSRLLRKSQVILPLN